MALKLPDSAVPMGDFPVAKAVDIDFDDGENLQEKLDDGKLGGGGSSSEKQIKDWVSGETYEIGDYVYYDGKLYRCTTENSDVDFSGINWKNLSGSETSGAMIDDNTVSTTTVFSSNKISTEYAKIDQIPILTSIINDDESTTYETYSSSKIEDIVAQRTDIDDTITAIDKTFSSDRIMKIINSASNVYKVDKKPSCVKNGDGTHTTTYVKDGETKTSNDTAWYYYIVDNILYQTIFIEGDELTIRNSNLSELISISETTHTWLIDGEDTGVSANAETLEPNINNSTVDYRLDIINSDGTKKFTTDNLKGADGVLLDNVGYYGFTIENGSLILHVNVEDSSTGNADDIAPPFSLDTGNNLWYTVGGKIKYVNKEVI